MDVGLCLHRLCMPVLVLARTFNVALYYLHTETWEALRILGTCSGIAKEWDMGGGGGLWVKSGRFSGCSNFNFNSSLLFVILFVLVMGSRVNDSAQDLGGAEPEPTPAKAVDRLTENLE